MKACVLVPLYDHGEPFEAVAEGLAKLGLPCLVVDDGSAEETRRRLARLLERHAWLEVHRRAVNGGRGAALKTGYRLAAERGFSHAVQLDADGQHDPLDVPRLLDAARARPEALVLGAPIFDASVPKSRLYGRQLSRAMVWLTTASFAVRDPLCGFRVIPLAPTLALLDRAPLGDRMEFDPELVIALCRSGVPVVNVPTKVVYREGGLSHFDLLGDNARLSRVYARALASLPAALSARVARALR